MGLTLYDIIKNMLNEAVSKEEVLNAIHNQQYVRIKYDDTKPDDKIRNPKGNRVIQPMAIGKTKAGNPVVRAFQLDGKSSRKGGPNWKFFRLDRVTSWKPFKKRFTAPPNEYYGKYNQSGDRSMSVMDDNVKFNFNTQGDVDVARMKDSANGPKVSVKNTKGPIPVNTGQQWKKVGNNDKISSPKSKQLKTVQKNIKDEPVKNDDFWKLYDLADAERDLNQQGPIKNSYERDYDIDDVDIEDNDLNNRR